MDDLLSSEQGAGVSKIPQPDIASRVAALGTMF